MNSLYVFVAIVCMWQQTINCVPCNCGLGRGESVCTEDKDDSVLVVRPQNLPTVDVNALAEPGRVIYKKIVTGGIAPLRPVGDLCSCGKTIIKPANVPRPACSSCVAATHRGASRFLNKGFSNQDASGFINEDASGFRNKGFRVLNHDSSSILNHGGGVLLNQGSLDRVNSGSLGFLNQGSSSSFQNSQSTIGTSSNIQQVGGLQIDYPVCGLPVIPKREVQFGSQVPADAVSRAIVLNELRKQRASVDHLQFGTRTTPKELTTVTKKQVFAEQNIHAHNGETLVLGDLYGDSPAEEEISEEEEEVEVEPQRVVVQPATFGDLGFVSNNVAPNRFINVPEAIQVSSSKCGVDAVSSCNDGFISGQVILKEDPVRQQVFLPESSVSCLGDEGNSRDFNGLQYTYSDSHGSSSSSNSRSTNSENFFFRRLGGL